MESFYQQSHNCYRETEKYFQSFFLNQVHYNFVRFLFYNQHFCINSAEIWSALQGLVSCRVDVKVFGYCYNLTAAVLQVALHRIRVKFAMWYVIALKAVASAKCEHGVQRNFYHSLIDA